MLNTNSFDFTMFAAAASGQKVSATSKAWDKTKSVTGKAVDAVKGVAPVTNNKFAKYLDKVDARLDNHDEQLWKLELLINHVANQQGVTLLSDEQVKEFYADYLKDEAEKAKALETNTAPATPAVSDEAVIERIKKMLFGTPEEVAQEVGKDVMLKTDRDLQEYMLEEAPAPVAEEKPYLESSVLEGIPTVDFTEQKEEPTPVIEQQYSEPAYNEYVEETKKPLVAPQGFKPCAGGCGRGLRADYESDKCSICRKQERDAKKEEVTVPSEPTTELPDPSTVPVVRHRIRFDD